MRYRCCPVQTVKLNSVQLFWRGLYLSIDKLLVLEHYSHEHHSDDDLIILLLLLLYWKFRYTYRKWQKSIFLCYVQYNIMLIDRLEWLMVPSESFRILYSHIHRSYEFFSSFASCSLISIACVVCQELNLPDISVKRVLANGLSVSRLGINVERTVASHL